MPHQLINDWLGRKAGVRVDGRSLRPRPHPRLPSAPLSVVRGQGEAFYLVDTDDGSDWIVKKFHAGRSPERDYLDALVDRIPAGPAFRSGSERRILTPADVSTRTTALKRWFDGTVFMPRIDGLDWATVADRIRSGDEVDLARRIAWSTSLAEAVARLEEEEVAHRDLSSGNVYIDVTADTVALIDWDSIFHPTLEMPDNTTLGTPGYMAAFIAESGGTEDTWRPDADRFALAVCIGEFLAMGDKTPLTGDGGMLSQDEIRVRAGETLDEALDRLREVHPGAASLFSAALEAEDFTDCPSPSDWLGVLGSESPVTVGPPLHLPPAASFTVPTVRPPSPPPVELPPLPRDPWSPQT